MFSSSPAKSEQENLIKKDEYSTTSVTGKIEEQPPAYTAVDLSNPNETSNLSAGDSLINQASQLLTGKINNPEENYNNLSKLDSMISLRSPMARDWIARQRESIRPWNIFFDQEKFSKPTTPNEITLRLTKNVKHFQANYLILILILAGYCLITSPLLLIAIAAFFGVQHVISGQQGIAYQQKIFGRELTETHQTIIASCVSVPLFIVAGATSAIFWVFGASAIMVGAHGAMRQPEIDPEEADTFLQETA